MKLAILLALCIAETDLAVADGIIPVEERDGYVALCVEVLNNE